MSFTAGRIVYHAYHRPLAWMQHVRNLGGIGSYVSLRRGQRAMQRAAARLAPQPTHGERLAVHFLTGRQFWYQTLFCAWSLARESGRNLVPHLYDDGSLTATHVRRIRRVFPSTVVYAKKDCQQRLEDHLPRHAFPHLHDRWHNYPNIRKLVDPHLAGDGVQLVLDSDMLFFSPPTELLDWADQNSSRPLVMTDIEESYGYPRDVLASLCGASPVAAVNVGITGLHGDNVDFETLEAWIDELHRRFGYHYFLEQALIALLITKLSPMILDAGRYRVLPDPGECEHPTAALHHYVAESKIGYFRHGWRRVSTI